MADHMALGQQRMNLLEPTIADPLAIWCGGRGEKPRLPDRLLLSGARPEFIRHL